jgi:hypothetical protein
VAWSEGSCADHSLTLTNVPAAETLYVVCKGDVDDRPAWQGRVDDIVVTAGQQKDIGTVDIQYIGYDTVAPEIAATYPYTDATDNDLIVARTGNGTGTVVSTTSGHINCGDTCHAELTAIVFIEWCVFKVLDIARQGRESVHL